MSGGSVSKQRITRTVHLLELLYGRRLDDVKNGNDLGILVSSDEDGMLAGGHTFSLTPASLKNLRSLSSRRVRRQNIEWSKGAIFLMATLRPLGLCMAEQTMPYAPSPTTSRTWYCVPAHWRP